MFLRETESERAVAATAHIHFTYYIKVSMSSHVGRPPARGGNRAALQLSRFLNLFFPLSLSLTLLIGGNSFFSGCANARHMNDCPFMRNETCKGARGGQKASVCQTVHIWYHAGLDMEHKPTPSIYQTLRIFSFSSEDLCAVMFVFPSTCGNLTSRL